jgi:hypothetical protein
MSNKTNKRKRELKNRQTKKRQRRQRKLQRKFKGGEEHYSQCNDGIKLVNLKFNLNDEQQTQFTALVNDSLGKFYDTTDKHEYNAYLRGVVSKLYLNIYIINQKNDVDINNIDATILTETGLGLMNNCFDIKNIFDCIDDANRENYMPRDENENKILVELMKTAVPYEHPEEAAISYMKSIDTLRNKAQVAPEVASEVVTPETVVVTPEVVTPEAVVVTPEVVTPVTQETSTGGKTRKTRKNRKQKKK